MYPASSSFRACTLRLPSVVCSRPFSSLNVSDSFAARALTIPSRIRSWIRRSSAPGVASVAFPRTPRNGSFSSSRFRAPPRGSGAAACLATVPPRDLDPEHDVNHPKPGYHQPLSGSRGREQRCRPEYHETESHHRNDPNGERSAGYHRGSVKKQPDTRQQVVRADPEERRREER